MSALYVVEHGATVRKAGDQLVVEKDDKRLLEVEFGSLASVVVLNTVQVTTQALSELLERGTELAFINQQGRLLGQLTPPLARNLEIRRAQFAREQDPDFALRQSKAILAAKIENQRQVFIRCAQDRPGSQEAIAAPALMNKGLRRHCPALLSWVPAGLSQHQP